MKKAKLMRYADENAAFVELMRREIARVEKEHGPFADVFSVIRHVIEFRQKHIDLEARYRAYARRINHGRRWRKVSWRRLNRRQRTEALLS